MNLPDSRKEKSKYEYVKELDIYFEKETGEVLEYKGLIDKKGYKSFTFRNKNGAREVVLVHRLQAYQKYGEKIFEKGFSTKGELHCGYGLFFVKNTLELINGFITIIPSNYGSITSIYIPKKVEI